jgi:acyl dehydratase
MPDLDELVGSEFGPFPVPVTDAGVEAFALATGDDPARWTEHAPPMFANVALFATDPTFHNDPAVVPFTRSLIHSEQSYEWSRPLAVGEELHVAGRIAATRARGPLNLVTFETTATSSHGPWLSGSSVFLMSQQAAGGSDDEGEPEADDRPGFTDEVGDPLALPGPDAALTPLQVGASRDDLARYAEASGDHNPIHLDHEAARRAGLGGVIVHGLLMGAWMANAAGRYGTLDSIRLRFRNPLRPAVAATVSGSQASPTDAAPVTLELLLATDDERLVTGRAAVTP